MMTIGPTGRRSCVDLPCHGRRRLLTGVRRRLTTGGVPRVRAGRPPVRAVRPALARCLALNPDPVRNRTRSPAAVRVQPLARPRRGARPRRRARRMTARERRRPHPRSGTCGCHGISPTRGCRRGRRRVCVRASAVRQRKPTGGQASSRTGPGLVLIGLSPRRIRTPPRSGKARHALSCRGHRIRRRPGQRRAPRPPGGRSPGPRLRPHRPPRPDRARSLVWGARPVPCRPGVPPA